MWWVMVVARQTREGGDLPFWGASIVLRRCKGVFVYSDNQLGY